MPKGVGTAFCSKTGRFFVCGPTKPWGTHECSKESGPRSAAKQGCSLCVAPLKCLPFRPKPCPWDLESKNGPLSARVCPKGSGPRSAAKQGVSLCVAPLNLSGAMSAPRSRGHVLQQNRAVLCVWPHQRSSCGSPCGRQSRVVTRYRSKLTCRSHTDFAKCRPCQVCLSFGTLKNLSSSQMLWVASRGGKCRAPQT